MILIISGVAYLLLQTSNRSFLYPDFGVSVPSKFAHFGIDISHHQGKINFEACSKMVQGNDSLEFIFIKATDGEGFIDPRLAYNSEQAGLNNIPLGFYHFYRPELSVENQVLFFTSILSMYPYQLRPVIDVEFNGGLTDRALQDSVYYFCNRVEQLVGVRPLIYTYEFFYMNHFIKSKLKSELYWIASYKDNCALMELENFIIWQFSEKGTVNGIKEKVDLNVAKKSFKEKVLLKKGASETK